MNARTSQAAAAAMQHAAEQAASKPRAMYSNFSWLVDSLKNDERAQFVALARDVARGAEVCMQVAHSDFTDRDAGHDTLFTIQQLEHLSLLASRSLKMLGDEAERIIEAMNEGAA